MAGSGVITSTAASGTGSQPSAPARPPIAPAARPRRRWHWPGIGFSSTPAKLRLLLVATVTACLAWGALAAAAVNLHAGAASDVITSSEPLSLDSQQLYRSLADADTTVSTGYLQGATDQSAIVTDQQRYDSDVSTATADLAAVTRAGFPGSATASLTTLNQDLPVYTGYVQDSQTDDGVGLLAAASYTEVASEEMREVLLPAAASVYAAENARLQNSSATATGLPLIAIVVVAAIAIGVLLVRAQRWLTVRTNRRVNPGLLVATTAGVVALLWLVVSFAVARSDLVHANAQGSGPAETLAQADITAAAARGDETLNLVSRAGDGSAFQQDFNVKKSQLDTELSAAAAASAPGGARLATAAGQAARDWFTVNNQVATLDKASSYTTETALVIGSGANTAATDFDDLDVDIVAATEADQAVFESSASAGSSAFGGLTVGIAVAAVVMAAGCAWGLSRRLAEYR